jgi:hypothetical protein
MDILRGVPTLVPTSHQGSGVSWQGIGWNMSQFSRSPACLIVHWEYGAWAQCTKPRHCCHLFKREENQGTGVKLRKANREPTVNLS